MAELLGKLWRGRFIVFGFAAVGLVAAAVYAFTARQVWTSVAYVSVPQLEQIHAYLDQRRAVARATDKKPVDPAVLSAAFFDRFIAAAAAAGTQQDYLEQSAYYARQVKETKAETPVAKRRLLLRLAKDLTLKEPDKKQVAQYYQVSFSADTAQAAQEVMSGYLAWVSNLAFKRVERGFSDQLDAHILMLQTELDDIAFNLKSDRQYTVENLGKALNTANLAGIKDYVVGKQTNGSTVIELSDTKRLFMLGEKYLGADLKTTQDSPIIYPPKYYEIQRQLNELKPLREQRATAQTYYAQLEPTLPVQRDKPKRSLILALGLILGGAIGVMWTLGAEALKSRKEDWTPAISSSGVDREALVTAGH